MFKSLSQFEFHQVLESTPGVSLVVFTGPACGACRTLKAILERDFSGHHLFEVDAGEEMGLTREFDVFHLPALFLYRDGVFHCEIKSEADPEPLRDAIASALASPSEEAP